MTYERAWARLIGHLDEWALDEGQAIEDRGASGDGHELEVDYEIPRAPTRGVQITYQIASGEALGEVVSFVG